VLTRTRFKPEARILVIVTGALIFVGIMAVYSASTFASMMSYGNGYHFALGHITRVFVGILLGAGAWKLPPRIWRMASVPLFGLCVLLMVPTIIPGCSFAPAVNGSSRWLVLGPLRMMPSELARFSYVILVATLVARGLVNPRRVSGVAVITGIAAIPAVMMIRQPDFAGVLFLFSTIAVMLFIGEARFAHMLLLFAGLAAVGALVLGIESYRLERMQGWLNQDEGTSAENYQPQQSCIALGSGGLMGRGLGRGRQQRGFLPEAFSDFILAVIGEETGFLGTSAVLAAFLALSICGWRIAAGADDAFGALAAGGLTASLCTGAFINIGVATRLLPTTGLTLPLVSWGGTSIIVTMVSLGIILRVAERAVR
jgi:cell division protein FtsW